MDGDGYPGIEARPKRGVGSLAVRVGLVHRHGPIRIQAKHRGPALRVADHTGRLRGQAYGVVAGVGGLLSGLVRGAGTAQALLHVQIRRRVVLGHRGQVRRQGLVGVMGHQVFGLLQHLGQRAGFLDQGIGIAEPANKAHVQRPQGIPIVVQIVRPSRRAADEVHMPATHHRHGQPGRLIRVCRGHIQACAHSAGLPLAGADHRCGGMGGRRLGGANTGVVLRSLGIGELRQKGLAVVHDRPTGGLGERLDDVAAHARRWVEDVCRGQAGPRAGERGLQPRGPHRQHQLVVLGLREVHPVTAAFPAERLGREAKGEHVAELGIGRGIPAQKLEVLANLVGAELVARLDLEDGVGPHFFGYVQVEGALLGRVRRQPQPVDELRARRRAAAAQVLVLHFSHAPQTLDGHGLEAVRRKAPERAHA